MTNSKRHLFLGIHIKSLLLIFFTISFSTSKPRFELISKLGYFFDILGETRQGIILGRVQSLNGWHSAEISSICVLSEDTCKEFDDYHKATDRRLIRSFSSESVFYRDKEGFLRSFDGSRAFEYGKYLSYIEMDGSTSDGWTLVKDFWITPSHTYLATDNGLQKLVSTTPFLARKLGPDIRPGLLTIIEKIVALNNGNVVTFGVGGIHRYTKDGKWENSKGSKSFSFIKPYGKEQALALRLGQSSGEIYKMDLGDNSFSGTAPNVPSELFFPKHKKYRIHSMEILPNDDVVVGTHYSKLFILDKEGEIKFEYDFPGRLGVPVNSLYYNQKNILYIAVSGALYKMLWDPQTVATMNSRRNITSTDGQSFSQYFNIQGRVIQNTRPRSGQVKFIERAPTIKGSAEGGL